MFLLMSAWSETLDKPGLTIPARIGITLTFAGVGMTVTSLTDFLAFMIGYSSVFFSVRSFCLYAGVAVLCVYLCHLTLFTACLSLHGRRVYSHRHFLTCRAVKPRQELKQERASIFYRYLCGGEPPKKPSEDESLCERLPRFFIPKLVTHRAVLYVVLVVFAALLGVSVYGAVNIEQGLKFKDLVLESSYYYDFITTKDKYFPDHIPIGFNILKELDYADGKVQQRVEDLITTAKEDGNILSDFEHCWLTAFLNSAFFKNVSFPQELQSFLVQNPVFNADIITDPRNSTRILASRCSVLSGGLEMQYDQADLMVRMREVADNSPLPVIAFQKDFELFEVYLATLPATLQTVGFAVVAIVVVCCFLLPHPFMVVLTTINILMIICNIFACMYFLGITLSSITMIHLVMSVGFSVDFSAHVCSAYLMSNSFTRKERAIDAITHAASPILNGGLSSLVGVLLLSTSETYIFSTFFKIMSFVLLFGILNSVIFLPAMLTLFGPEKQATIQPMNSEGHEKSNGMVPGSVFTNGTATGSLKSNGLVNRPFVIGGATAENGGDNPGIRGLCNGTVYMIEVDSKYTAEIKSCNGIMLVAETDRKTTTLFNGTIHPVGSASNTTESAKCNGTVPMAEADNTTDGTPCIGTVPMAKADNTTNGTPCIGTVPMAKADNTTNGTPCNGTVYVGGSDNIMAKRTPSNGTVDVIDTDSNRTQGTPTIGTLQVAETNDNGTQGTQCSGTVGLTQGTETLHVTEADCNATKEMTCAGNAGADITAKRTPSNGTDDVIESDSNGTQETPSIGTLQVAEEADSNATKEIPCAGIAGSDSSTVNGPQHTRQVPATQLHGDTASRTAPCTDHTPKTTTENDSSITKQSQLAPRLQKVRGSVETFERERSKAREWRAQQQQNMSKRLIRMRLSSKVTPQTNETMSGRNDKVQDKGVKLTVLPQ
ncbi:patched domain-containing protein 3-like [Littorina saxatilis]|uniref:SSD domain-containing protein n=1 Tax=Littorina saxatilis TaxID=31220 RepID=A0AAN9B7W3_9CAEN